MELNRYLVFAGSYFQYGGWEDFQGSYATREEAEKAIWNDEHGWWQIVDTETGEVEKDMEEAQL